MPQTKLKRVNNAKLKSFLLFLLLATLFWVLAKFSKEYSATVGATLNYVNIPNNTLLAKNNLEEVSFDLFTTGFEVFFYKLKKPSIDIPVSKYYERGDENIVVSSEEFARLVSNQLSNTSTLRNLSVAEIQVHLNGIVSKQIPVRPTAKLNFKEGFKPVGVMRSDPDSITISGPAHLVDSLHYIETIPISVENVEKDISIVLALKKPKNKEITMSKENIKAYQQVAEYTQKRITLMVKPLNIPSGLRVKLIPELISITFNVSLDDFKEISASDFELVCDYNERNKVENFMIPHLRKQPDMITDVEFETKKVDFLIFK